MLQVELRRLAISPTPNHFWTLVSRITRPSCMGITYRARGPSSLRAAAAWAGSATGPPADLRKLRRQPPGRRAVDGRGARRGRLRHSGSPGPDSGPGAGWLPHLVGVAPRPR